MDITGQTGFGEIRVPDVGPALTPGGRTKFKRIIRGRIKGFSEPVFEVERSLSEDGKTELVTVTTATCAGCGEFFMSEADAAGACFYCDHVLCAKCMVERRCAGDRRPSCAKCGTYSHLYGTTYNCIKH